MSAIVLLPVPLADPLGGLTPSAFALEAAREARARGLTDTADRWAWEAYHLAREEAAPLPWEACWEVMPDGSAPIRLSFNVRVF